MDRLREELVHAEFEDALHRAFVRDLFGKVARRPNDLVSYQEVRRSLVIEGQRYRGVQTLEIARIVGSTDRVGDFDGAFRPRRTSSAGRWKSIARAHYEGSALPPIQVHQIGDVYFVKDGNHRISVARQRGQELIDAEVIEEQVRAGLLSEARPAARGGLGRRLLAPLRSAQRSVRGALSAGSARRSARTANPAAGLIEPRPRRHVASEAAA